MYWVIYFNLVTLVKKYIHDIRSDDWDGTLRCVQQMKPFFHDCGHFAYSKCHLYKQDMQKLRFIMAPEEYEKFANEEYFTMRRMDRFCIGIWSDLTIEQTLMQNMKSVSGIALGWGVTYCFVSKWVLGLTATHDIRMSLEEFRGVNFSFSEQHEDFREAYVIKSTSSDKAVGEAGNRFFLKLSRAPAKEPSLNLHHYYSFTQSVSNAKPAISVLAPMKEAAKRHSFRVYHQVELWLGNEIPPELWEWGHKQNQLMPITTEDPIAPDSILNIICWKL
ncbi:hypothetical protein PR048_018092 [Dryococelus australis]|uniref:Uncharacterized protein n=1 Tax=Dryococelus australis TaxID=614101 RepID=A0ABQ9HBG5_9NEOP|nr:hypothetical protein PR048_018092 [Dryococelus australis]